MNDIIKLLEYILRIKTRIRTCHYLLKYNYGLHIYTQELTPHRDTNLLVINSLKDRFTKNINLESFLITDDYILYKINSDKKDTDEFHRPRNLFFNRLMRLCEDHKDLELWLQEYLIGNI